MTAPAIRASPGYRLAQLKAFINPHKQTRPDPVVRFATAPGEQMHADFTVVRRGRDACCIRRDAQLQPRELGSIDSG